MVERTGSSIRTLFSQGSLWQGQECGRGEECLPCSQDAEDKPPCTRVSALYENFCVSCNPEAKGSKEFAVKMDPPSIYIGETSRSLQERFKEHQDDRRKESEKSHMWKHSVLHHQGEEVPFRMKAVEFFKTALSRQTAEAVRIRRRGGGYLKL